ncbi:A coat protein [Xanthomonas euvesicatoria]|uniref:A coat protein n=1 Tax=Xanthomonas euvesicatoria TaxID=456327 RepID=UPI001C43A4A2|nr:A coat protein [Xanthomonas euvesicatoria]MBV6871796.1 A coat protein [Xanthomonas campestris pv. veroniae]
MRGLGGYFARAVVRRLAYALVAIGFAALAQMCAMPAARAADCPYGNKVCDQGTAFAMCKSAIARTQEYFRSRNVDFEIRVTMNCELTKGDAGSAYYCAVNAGETRCNNSDGSNYDNFSFPDADTCAARNKNKLSDAIGYSPPSTCVGGCEVQGTSYSQAQGPVKVYGMRDRTYNGSTCTPTKPTNDIGETTKDQEEAKTPKAPECTALGSGQTGCVKPNGDYCATASTGKTFCWTPNETGKKSDATDAQVKSPKGDPVTPPPIPSPDGDWQRKEGHQQTTCVNNTCTTYNVTNYSSVPAGTSKNSSGDNSADGTGNTSGNGSQSDDGDKDNDDKDSATDSGNCSTPPICVGDTLKCLQLKFTWKIECNTQGNEITKGDGCGEGDVPVCAGKSCKAEAYSQVLQQWKQRCAVEAMGQGMAARAAGISNGDDAGVVEGIWGGQSGGTGLTLRQDLVNVGGGGNARLLPDVEIEGHRWTVPQGFFDAIAAVKMVIISMCAVIAMFVVGRYI